MALRAPSSELVFVSPSHVSRLKAGVLHDSEPAIMIEATFELDFTFSPSHAAVQPRTVVRKAEAWVD